MISYIRYEVSWFYCPEGPDGPRYSKKIYDTENDAFKFYLHKLEAKDYFLEPAVDVNIELWKADYTKQLTRVEP